MMGVELESAFAPTVIQARTIANKLVELGLVTRERLIQETNTSGISYQLLNYIRPVFTRISPLLYKAVHTDGGGFEFSMLPASLKAHQALLPEYIELLKTLRSWGFSDLRGGDGIHINIDYTMFGDTPERRVTTMANILWLGYRNSSFFTEQSGRVFWEQINADISYMLGDPFEWDDSAVRLQKFMRNKQPLLNVIGGIQSGGSAFNVIAGKDGRQAIEVRWFGSTLNPITYMGRIEFMHSLIKYGQARTNETEISLVDYVRFVMESAHVEGYLYLLDILSQSEYTGELINQYIPISTMQQQMPTDASQYIPISIG